MFLGIFNASITAFFRFLSNTPAPLFPITFFGAATGYAATGRPHAIASNKTNPKVSVLLGNTKTSAF